MYDAALDEPCQVRQMALLDELGQVSHIFSDKTGTLTSNHMEFRRCFIFHPDGQAYGCGETAISKSLAESAQRREASKQQQGGSKQQQGGGNTGKPAAREAYTSASTYSTRALRPAGAVAAPCRRASRQI